MTTGCGGPSFKPSDIARVEVEYAEFRDADLNSADPVRAYNVIGSLDATKKASVPAVGMPRRDQAFRGDLGGNSIVNGNITTYTTTTQGAIFGRSGRYDEVAMGRKVYGNPTQGDAQLAFKNNTQPDCQTRTQYVAVTATTDQASLTINFASVAFYVPPVVDTSSASFLSMTAAAVFGLLSLAFF